MLGLCGNRLHRGSWSTRALDNYVSARFVYGYVDSNRVGGKEWMQLLPHHIRAKLPGLYANEEKGLEALALVKFFTPDAHWTWYASEFDGDDTFFGLVAGDEIELGYFSLRELESVRGALGLPIERDLYFEATSLSALLAMHKQQQIG